MNKKISKFDHLRFKGSDYKKGDLLISKGTILQPNHILALKTLGIKKLKSKKPNILFFQLAMKLLIKKKFLNGKLETRIAITSIL